MLRSHLDLIGRNEPIQRKAKFWQSYVRALKGTDDMRAPESSRRPYGVFRPLYSSDYPEYSWPSTKSIYDDPIHAHDRITTPGYRYDPVSRETYGMSPRNLYPHHLYGSGRYRPGGYYPYSNYGYDPMYLGEKEPEDKELHPYLDSFTRDHPHYYNPVYSLPKSLTPSYKPWNYTPLPYHSKPLPKKPDTPSAFNFQGQPLSDRGGLHRRPLSDLLDPHTTIPWSSIVRDPWWWDYPELKPYKSPYSSPYSSTIPFYLRDSYLSPIKRQYLWTKHPIRPLSALY